MPRALASGVALGHIRRMAMFVRYAVPFALALMTAAGLYWVMGPGLGLSDHMIIAGGLAGAGLVGFGYSLDTVLRRLK